MPPADLRRMSGSIIITIFAVIVTGLSQEAPRITEGPAPEVFYERGSTTFSLRCITSGSPRPNITWFQDGRPLTPDEMSHWKGPEVIYPLSRENSSHSPEGRYQCRAENQHGVDFSNLSTVKEAVLEKKHNLRPSKIEDFEPPIVLPCDFVTSVPSASITWFVTDCNPKDCDRYRDEGAAGNDVGCRDCYITNYKACKECGSTFKPVSFNDSISQLENGNLLLFGLPKGDITFRCGARNHILGKRFFGSYARVIVDNLPVRHKKNYFSDSPTIVLEGKDVRLRCVFAGSTAARVEWTKDGRELNWSSSVQSKNNGFTLYIESVSAEDDGEYRCRLAGSTTTHTIDLKVHRPAFLIGSFDSQVAEDGKSATFICRGGGTPSPILSWTYNGEQIGERWNNSHSLRGDGEELTLEGVRLVDRGLVVCNITNMYGTRLCRAELSVIPRKEIPTTPAPPRVTTESETTRVPQNIEPNTTHGAANDTFKANANSTKAQGSTESSSTTTEGTRDTINGSVSHLHKLPMNNTSERRFPGLSILIIVISVVVIAILFVSILLITRKRVFSGKGYEVDKQEARFGLNPMRDKDYDSDDSGIGNDEKDGLKKKGKKKLERDVKIVDGYI